jgi:hypothetical protein
MTPVHGSWSVPAAPDDVKARAVEEAGRRWPTFFTNMVGSREQERFETFAAGAEWAAGLLADPDALAKAKAEALREAAEAWQLGEWADAPRCADRVQERIANGQHVGDWLRARANQINPEEPR